MNSTLFSRCCVAVSLSCFAASCSIGHSSEALNASRHEIPEACNAGWGQYLPQEFPGLKITYWTADDSSLAGSLCMTGFVENADKIDINEWTERLDFAPTAITGDGKRRMFVVGLDSSGCLVDQFDINGLRSSEVVFRNRLFHSMNIGAVTDVAWLADPEERLILVDCEESTLWCFRMSDGHLSVMANKSEFPKISGMKRCSIRRLGSSPIVEYNLSTQFANEDNEADDARLLTLIDDDDDARIDRVGADQRKRNLKLPQ